MWNFLPGGLLMPAAIPMDLVDPKWTEDGVFDFQIRARVKSHLENFIRDYMEPGTYNPEIQATPEMDYNFRFYTTREAYAAAMAKAIMDIDYEKFKPTAERKDEDGNPLYAEGKKYHRALNQMWGTITMLNAPGGAWALPSKKKGKRGGYHSFSTATGETRRTGDSFHDSSSLFDWDEEDWGVEDSTPDFIPVREEEADQLYFAFKGMPEEEVREYLDEREMALLLEFHPRMFKESRKKNRKSRYRNRSRR